jgi:para-aminobenzoate synthetase/4-amino-4-deoxychorismate lyase
VQVAPLLSRPFVLLEDRLASPASARLFTQPLEIVRCDAPDAVDAALARLEAGLARGLHAAGMLAYELGHVLELRLAGRPPKAARGPLMLFGLFAAPRVLSGRELDAVFGALAPPPPIRDLTPGHDARTHVAKVKRVLDLIAAGDAYQVNLTFPMRFRQDGDPLALYAALRARQPVAHGGVVALDATTVLSVSPELFVDIRDGRATTRPMKGTAARSADPVEDAAHRRALLANPKQRAENLMIVDLLRNDLARIAEPGSVRTPELFTVETYPSFHTLTSTVTARLRPGLSLREQLAALFPCGSIVGAPKIRAAEIIADLETEARGVYTGAIGALAPDGDMAFNVAIRTTVIEADGQGVYGVGGGVVADSDPQAEYEEALLKARVLSGLAEDFGLIETFRWSADEGFPRLTAHLDRLETSARTLGFGFERGAAEALVAAAARSWTDGDRRVRLLLARSGELSLGDMPAGATSPEPLKLHVAAEPLDPGDPFLRHKTTRREAHERAFVAAAALGLDEAVLLNRYGEVADASRNSVFLEVEGRLVTPPVSAGALPGVLRAALIADGRAVEGRLWPDDLRQAGGLFVGNSLHGLRNARLA